MNPALEAGMMNDFRCFIESEVDAMFGEMDEAARIDPQLRQEWAIRWIAEHAEEFRDHWNQSRCNSRSGFAS